LISHFSAKIPSPQIQPPGDLFFRIVHGKIVEVKIWISDFSTTIHEVEVIPRLATTAAMVEVDEKVLEAKISETHTKDTSVTITDTIEEVLQMDLTEVFPGNEATISTTEMDTEITDNEGKILCQKLKIDLSKKITDRETNVAKSCFFESLYKHVCDGKFVPMK
jgi:hypothetical protein